MMKNLFLVLLAICVMTTNAQAAMPMPAHPMQHGAPVRAVRGGFLASLHARLATLRARASTGRVRWHRERTWTHHPVRHPAVPVRHPAVPVRREHATSMTQPMPPQLLTRKQANHVFDMVGERRGHVNQWHKRHMPSKTTSEKSSMMHNEMFNAMPNKWANHEKRFNPRFGLHNIRRGHPDRPHKFRHGGPHKYRHGGIVSEESPMPHYRHGGKRSHQKPVMSVEPKPAVDPVMLVTVSTEQKKERQCPIRALCGDVFMQPDACAPAFVAMFGKNADKQQRGIASVRLAQCAGKYFSTHPKNGDEDVSKATMCHKFLATTTWYQCRDDVLRYCRHEIAVGDRHGTHRCLRQNREKLSGECGAALALHQGKHGDKHHGNVHHWLDYVKLGVAAGMLVITIALAMVFFHRQRKINRMHQARLVQGGMQADPSAYPAQASAAVLMSTAPTSYVPVRI